MTSTILEDGKTRRLELHYSVVRALFGVLVFGILTSLFLWILFTDVFSTSIVWSVGGIVIVTFLGLAILVCFWGAWYFVKRATDRGTKVVIDSEGVRDLRVHGLFVRWDDVRGLTIKSARNEVGLSISAVLVLELIGVEFVSHPDGRVKDVRGQGPRSVTIIIHGLDLTPKAIFEAAKEILNSSSPSCKLTVEEETVAKC